MSGDHDPGRGAAARTLQLIGEVQAFGLASAAKVAERYIEMVDGYLARGPGSRSGSSDGHADDPPSAHADRMARVVALTSDLVSAVVTSGARPDSRGEGLDLPPARPGEWSQASLWVHNPTPVPADVTARVSSLESALGHLLPRAAVVVDPPHAAYVDAGGSAEVTVRVLVPCGTAPGHFHALVTSTSTPGQALPLHLEVLVGDP